MVESVYLYVLCAITLIKLNVQCTRISTACVPTTFNNLIGMTKSVIWFDFIHFMDKHTAPEKLSNEQTNKYNVDGWETGSENKN